MFPDSKFFHFLGEKEGPTTQVLLYSRDLSFFHAEGLLPLT